MLTSGSIFFVLDFETLVASFDKVMVDCGVGVSRGTDGHLGEIQVADGVGGDRGGDGILFPSFVGLANKDSSPDEAKADNNKPKSPC